MCAFHPDYSLLCIDRTTGRTIDRTINCMIVRSVVRSNTLYYNQSHDRTTARTAMRPLVQHSLGNVRPLVRSHATRCFVPVFHCVFAKFGRTTAVAFVKALLRSDAITCDRSLLQPVVRPTGRKRSYDHCESPLR